MWQRKCEVRDWSTDPTGPLCPHAMAGQAAWRQRTERLINIEIVVLGIKYAAGTAVSIALARREPR